MGEAEGLPGPEGPPGPAAAGPEAGGAADALRAVLVQLGIERFAEALAQQEMDIDTLRMADAGLLM
eukprot:1681839-Alexandrium_andersonii.AAC.1